MKGRFIMQINIYAKQYFKDSIEVKRAINSAADNLYLRISMYENQNIPFCQIFNDSKVKYDKHGEFFTFKCKKNNMQLRILYSYIIVDCTPVILIADYIVKKKNAKEYIRRFDAANEWNSELIFKESVILENN